MTTSTTGSPLSAPAASPASLHLAVIGAGPVGLALALHAARRLPQARICVHDRLPASHDVTADPRTLALSQGSVVELRRLVTGQMIGERIVIESGLQAGDRVIVAGLQKVRPGVPVKVAQAKPAGAGQAATPNKAE